MDLQMAKQNFNEYVKKYDLNMSSIERKYHHSYRVASISKLIAEDLEFDKEEIELAILIGLLHDIARFEQWTRYETYIDSKSIDHADFGVQILKENNFLRDFIENDKYDNIVLTAIKNHNKFKVEDGIDEYTLKFCKLIRDADKIDILYLATSNYYNDEQLRLEIQNSKITDEYYMQISNNKVILRTNTKKYPLDRVLNQISFIYDLNYNYSKKYIYEKNYINQILDLFDFSNNKEKDKIENIRNQANQFLRKEIFNI